MNETDHKAQCRKTLLKILKETAGHYTSKNRSIDEDGCLYRNKDNNKCAIGRTMKKSCLDRLEREGNLSNQFDTLIDNEYIDANDFHSRYHITGEMLKNKDFVEILSLVQNLHDEGDFWDKKGLSRMGRNYAHEIEGQILNAF